MTEPQAQPGSRSRLAGLFVPVGTLLVLVMMIGLIYAVAGKTLGYDFEAYRGAAQRLVSGERLYDPSVSVAGGFAIYLYPPPFAVAMVPLLALPDDLARVLWFLAMALCLPAGAALLPVDRRIRWLIVLLGALNWPFLYSVKLGQVGPLLFLILAAAWRWRDRAGPLGVAIALGTLIKIQPGLLIPWAAVTRRFPAAVAAVLVTVAVAAVATVATGWGAWLDYVALLGRVSSAVTTLHNCSPGAVLYQAGAPEALASLVQMASTVLAAGAVLLAWRFARPEASLAVTVVASQLLTPLLWDHYAVLLLLPTAWLLERGRTWAVVFPLAGWISLFDSGSSWLPSASVPLVFFGCLAALLWEAALERRRARIPGAASTPASAT
ncbi:MAG: glycosyltransferase family 87 protein [Candidatus Limnocylindrales bacterium]|jgi:hypothetical protein